jgi:hypothetical protein
MDDFDRRLEIELAHLLDPIVDAPVPRSRRQSNLYSVEGGPGVNPPEISVVHESMAAVAPVGTAS